MRRDPVTRMTPIRVRKRGIAERVPMTQNVSGSARPPEAGRSPAASDVSARKEVNTSAERPMTDPRPAGGSGGG